MATPRKRLRDTNQLASDLFQQGGPVRVSAYHGHRQAPVASSGPRRCISRRS